MPNQPLLRLSGLLFSRVLAFSAAPGTEVVEFSLLVKFEVESKPTRVLQLVFKCIRSLTVLDSFSVSG